MKKSLLVLAVAMLSTSAFAGNPVVSEVVKPGSDVNVVAGLESKTCTAEKVVVNLGKVGLDEVSKQGAKAEQQFQIKLTGCPGVFWEAETVGANQVVGKLKHVSVTFDGDGAVGQVTSDGKLKNIYEELAPAVASKNVVAEIWENGQVVDLKNPSIQQVKELSENQHQHDFDFKVRLVGKGGSVEPGLFVASVPFNIVYK